MCDKCIEAYANCLSTLTSVPLYISTPNHRVDFGEVSLDISIDPFEPKGDLTVFITVDNDEVVESRHVAIKYCPFCGEQLSDVVQKLEEVENNKTEDLKDKTA